MTPTLDPDNTYFTADTHFGHKLMVRKYRQAFQNVDEMDAALVRAWNETVRPHSVVFHLGDISFRSEARTCALIAQLNGQITLIEGNHDRGFGARFVRCFSELALYKEVVIEGQRIVLFHFPIASWHAVHRGSWHLHGHSHGSSTSLGRRLDVGVDCQGLRPISFREVQCVLAGREIASGDGHLPGMHDAVNDPVHSESQQDAKGA